MLFIVSILFGPKKGAIAGFNILAAIVSIPFMLGGYYICEMVLFSSLIIPAASIPGNIVQNVVGIVVAIPVVIALKKIPFFKS